MNLMVIKKKILLNITIKSIIFYNYSYNSKKQINKGEVKNGLLKHREKYKRNLDVFLDLHNSN
jgi:hypothetical protein